MDKQTLLETVLQDEEQEAEEELAETNRPSKGVWIPIALWLTDDLTPQEKMFLVEIYQLDNEKGCFARNSHFGEFFSLGKTRVSQVINSLEKKGYIKISYENQKNGFRRRIINVDEKRYYGLDKYAVDDERRTQKCKTTLHESGHPHTQKCKHERTSIIDNTNIREQHCSPNGELNVSPKGELNAKQLRSNCMEPHQKSNWSITRNHIISLSNKMGYEGDQVSDCLMVVKYFYSQYERFLGKEHPNLNDTTMRKVLTAFYNPEVDCKYVTDTDFTVYEALIDNYFESDMPGVDKSIVHFMSGGVRDIRYIKATM